MSRGFPSFSVGPCMPTHSPEMAGKNTMPAAQSYSSRCSQTANVKQRHWCPKRGGKSQLSSISDSKNKVMNKHQMETISPFLGKINQAKAGLRNGQSGSCLGQQRYLHF
uniref:Uncharacterized protein n=1 Tax=Chelydra serpentina TaxID=8475 RepID=A0A8C3XQU5_CHESE